MSKHLSPNKKTNSKKAYIPEDIQEEILEESLEAAHAKKPKLPRKYGLLPSLIVPVLLLIAALFIPLEGWYILAIYAVVFLIAALDYVWDMLDSCQNKDYFSTGNIVLLASILCFCSGSYTESVLILLVFKLIKLIYAKVEKNSREKLNNFTKIKVNTADVETAEGRLSLDPEHISVGDIVFVDAGAFVPVDGVIVEGISTIDTSALSGQNLAWAVNEGHRVYSGCRNITSPIKIKATKPYGQSSISRLVKLAESSVEYHSRQEKFIHKIKRYYCIGLFIAALVLTIAISIINGQWLNNLHIAAVILTLACTLPALSAIGLAYVKCTGILAETGVFSKGSDCVEAMAKSETLVFDKTGIITEGKYIITDVFPNKVTEHELLTIAATAERFSRHPVAAALREAAGKIDIDYRSLQIEEIPGRGISAFVGEKQVFVGNTALLEEHGIKCAIPTRPGAAIHVAVDYRYWGHILITDRIRRGAFDALESLRAQGAKKMVLLTGDVLSVAKPLASKLNFDMLRAELKPSEKAAAIDYLMSNRGDSTALAFIGDGNSDEQIMNRVDVGIALGALGSDAAIASADVLIMDRDIKKLPTVFRLSRLTYHINLINLIAWLATNALLAILGALGIVPALLAVIAEFILTFAMFINMTRIK